MKSQSNRMLLAALAVAGSAAQAGMASSIAVTGATLAIEGVADLESCFSIPDSTVSCTARADGWEVRVQDLGAAMAMTAPFVRTGSPFEGWGLNFGEVDVLGPVAFRASGLHDVSLLADGALARDLDPYRTTERATAWLDYEIGFFPVNGSGPGLRGHAFRAWSVQACNDAARRDASDCAAAASLRDSAPFELNETIDVAAGRYTFWIGNRVASAVSLEIPEPRYLGFLALLLAVAAGSTATGRPRPRAVPATGA